MRIYRLFWINSNQRCVFCSQHRRRCLLDYVFAQSLIVDEVCVLSGLVFDFVLTGKYPRHEGRMVRFMGRTYELRL